MSENIITIHQIVENLRGMPKKFEAHNELGHLLVLDIENLADRIEAAYKQTVTQCTHFNGAKMREALELCDKIMSDVVVGVRDIGPLEAFDEMGGIIDQALADPPRNCDVGTPREQELRMDEWCHDGKGHCRCGDDGCPNYNLDTNCVFDWLQMPYEGGGAK